MFAGIEITAGRLHEGESYQMDTVGLSESYTTAMLNLPEFTLQETGNAMNHAPRTAAPSTRQQVFP